MKRFLVALFLLTMLAAGANAGVKDKLLLYLPNRIIDLTDIFSLSLGVGPCAKVELRATRACGFGGGIGATANVYKEYNRQYGYGLDNGWAWNFTCVGAENYERTHTNRWVQEYWQEYTGFASPENNIYNFYEGARDYWELGGDFGLGVVAHVAIHPVEIFDFVAGIFFIDIKGDDITSDDFQ